MMSSKKQILTTLTTTTAIKAVRFCLLPRRVKSAIFLLGLPISGRADLVTASTTADGSVIMSQRCFPPLLRGEHQIMTILRVWRRSRADYVAMMNLQGVEASVKPPAGLHARRGNLSPPFSMSGPLVAFLYIMRHVAQEAALPPWGHAFLFICISELYLCLIFISCISLRLTIDNFNH